VPMQVLSHYCWSCLTLHSHLGHFLVSMHAWSHLVEKKLEFVSQFVSRAWQLCSLCAQALLAMADHDLNATAIDPNTEQLNDAVGLFDALWEHFSSVAHVPASLKRVCMQCHGGYVVLFGSSPHSPKPSY